MKKNTRYAVFIILLCASLCLDAQTPVIEGGRIEFERKVDVYSFLEQFSSVNGGPASVEKYQQFNEQFKKTTFILYFDDQKTFYEPSANEIPSGNEVVDFLQQAAGGNVVYTDRSINQSIMQKKVFLETYLIKDSIRNINWKLTNETREIAGFTCRRANAVIMDSLHIIAFYCDRIRNEGGPESFSGLPGMILGVALPAENITWFATKIIAQPISPNKLMPPSKGRQVNSLEFKENLEKTFKKSKFRSYILGKSIL